MQTSNLVLNKTSLLELMQDFYTLTGIRIVIFDSSYHEILSWPQSRCDFCRLMHEHEVSARKCDESDYSSFERCRKKGALEIYHCHAGLVEASAPLIDNGIIVGYVMFGQISDLPSEADTVTMLKSVMKTYKLGTCPEHIFQITHKNSNQIQAAAKILEACTFYVLFKNMVTLQQKNFIQNLNTFLLEHLSEDLSVKRLMNEFQISRNRLYDSASEYLGQGIAEYIKTLRIKEAQRLLKETNFAIHEIADNVGFNDYNYFCRVFKKEVGISAKKYRKLTN